MRDLETIDSELRLLAAVRWSIRQHGGEPSNRQVDELLDERNKLAGSQPGRTPRIDPRFVRVVHRWVRVTA
jgi:hypothetical protein